MGENALIPADQRRKYVWVWI